LLNPDAVAGLRLQVRQTPEVFEFRGNVIKRSPLAAAPPGFAHAVTAAEMYRGQLRPPAHIFGTPTDPSCMNGIRAGEQAVPKVVLSVVPHARIIGNNCVVGPDGQAYAPSAAETGAELDKMLAQNRENHQGFVAEQIGGSLYGYYVAHRSPIYRKTRSVFLHNLEPANYGSFLFRQLPQILLLKDIFIEFDAYIVPDRTPWLREALQLIGLPNRPIFTVREIAGDTFESIALFNEFDAEGFASELIASKLGALARTVWPATIGDRSRKLYLSRRLGTTYRPDYRPLTNEPEIEELFRQNGYSVVYPETLDFAGQIGLFRQATHIAGPSGSGMLNAMFAEPGVRVLDMESFHYTVRQHAKIYSSSGKEYAFLFGIIDRAGQRPLHVAPWSAPRELVQEALNWLTM